MIQLQVLNYFLNTKDSSLITLNNLTEKYFSDYKNEFNYIYNHFQQYGNIPDKETFLTVFPKFDLIDVQENPKYLIDQLFKDYQMKELIRSYNNVRTLIMDNKVDKAIDIIKNTNETLSAGIAIQPVDLLKDTSRYNDYLTKLNNFNTFYLSTGLKEVDDLIGGIDREEELALIMARTNKGKSWLLLKLASAAVAKGLNVGFYSGEMSANKVGYRLDTLLGHINNGSLIHGNVDVENDYKEYIKELPNKYKGSFKVITPNELNGYATVSDLRAFIEKENLDILFIDQISLMEDEKKAKNPTEKINNISKALKKLQVLKKIPIISVSQQNRTKNDEGEDTITSDQVAKSDDLGQDSTLILGITRDKKDDTLFTIHFVKARDNSAAGKKITYKVNLNRGEFYYIPTEDKENNLISIETEPQESNGGNIF